MPYINNGLFIYGNRVILLNLSFTLNLLPRSKAAGFNQAVGFFGMAMAPWSALWLNKFHPSLPFYVMGSMLIIAAISAISVKETSGTKLLETIRDKHKIDEDGITKLLVV